MPKQDLQCPFCPKTSSRGTGLASHIRGAHRKQYAGWSKARKSGGTVPVAIPKPAGGTSAFGDIVARLEHQRDAIDAALTALREIGAVSMPSAAPGTESTADAKPKRKRQLTQKGRQRLIAALKKRWAAKKAEQSRPVVKKRGRPKKR